MTKKQWKKAYKKSQREADELATLLVELARGADIMRDRSLHFSSELSLAGIKHYDEQRELMTDRGLYVV
jgi:hypothetical protein